MPAADVEDDNSDVVVTLDDGSRWAATFVTYRNIETLRRKNADSGECLSGRYIWAANLILVAEITRPAVEAVVAHLQHTVEFQTAFQRLVQTDSIRLLYDSADLRGTCYFELLPGRYEGRCWNERSVFVEEETWGYIEPIIQLVAPQYGHYSFADVPVDEWREAISRLRAVADEVRSAQNIAQLPSDIGFFYSTSRREFAAAFRENRKALVAFIDELCTWIERQLLTHETIAVLGI